MGRPPPHTHTRSVPDPFVELFDPPRRFRTPPEKGMDFPKCAPFETERVPRWLPAK